MAGEVGWTAFQGSSHLQSLGYQLYERGTRSRPSAQKQGLQGCMMQELQQIEGHQSPAKDIGAYHMSIGSTKGRMTVPGAAIDPESPLH